MRQIVTGPRRYNPAMTSGLRLPQPNPPAWLHGGPYFLIALALHALVLFYPLSLAIKKYEMAPPAAIMATLTESPPTPQLTPPAMPEKPAAQRTQHREKPVRESRPILALPAQPASAPPTFTVPAPVLAPPAPQPAPASSAAPATTISSPRFDAAYLHNPHPEYPPISRRIGEEGKVLLKVRVTPDGRPAAVDVEKSSNFDRLDEAARQAVARWRFVPAKRGDEPIEASVIVPIVFRLDS